MISEKIDLLLERARRVSAQGNTAAENKLAEALKTAVAALEVYADPDTVPIGDEAKSTLSGIESILE